MHWNLELLPFGCKKESGETKNERVKMKSIVNEWGSKVCGTQKNVRYREKTYGPLDICKLQKKPKFYRLSISSPLSFANQTGT